MMKRTKTFKAVLTFALSMALCLTSVAPAFAAAPPESGLTEGTATSPAAITLTKNLQMPIGTTTPAATFNFTFTPVSIDGDEDTEDTEVTNTMPAISGTVTFETTEEGATASGVKTVSKDATIAFTGNFPHAGVYTYTVTEAADANTYGPGESMICSNASYEISVYVANGTTAGALYIAAVGSSNAEGKTPAVFTNVYQKTAAVTISKVVVGAYADQTKYFDYNLTITKPATIDASTTLTHKVYVMEGANVVTSTDNYAGTLLTDGTDKYIEVTAGTPPISVKLKHGQYLYFTDAAVGATYRVVETAVTDYTASLSLAVNDESATTGDSDLDTGVVTIKEGTNSAAYTNTYKNITPTGLDINNLPFVMMIVLAASALVVFVVVKSRRKAYGAEN